jgi:hypothetical protein
MSNFNSPEIITVLMILFNLLYFVLVMFLMSFFIEVIWIGRSQWIILPLVIFSLAALGFHPTLFLHNLEAVTGTVSFLGILVITGFAILAGMIASSL